MIQRWRSDVANKAGLSNQLDVNQLDWRRDKLDQYNRKLPKQLLLVKAYHRDRSLVVESPT